MSHAASVVRSGLLLLLGGLAASVTASEHLVSPESTGGVASVVDLALPSTPSTSREVLVQRLVLLGADTAAAESFAAAVEALPHGEPGDPVADLDPALGANLGLSAELSAKALRLGRALVAGDPVALVGVQPPVELLDRVHALQSNGIDADVATWLARQELAVEDLPVTDAPPSGEPLEIRSAPTRRDLGGAVAIGDGRGREIIPPSEGFEPMGFCRTCPSVDVVLGTPTSSWQTHASSITQGSCKIYRFILAANKRYRFTFCDGGGTASFDTMLEAYGANCQLVDSNNDNCLTLSQITVNTTAQGYLYVKVSGNGGAYGGYTLAYREQPASPPGSCRSCPDYDTGTFNPTEPWQRVTVNVPANGCRIIRFNVLVNHSYQFSTCDGGGSSSFDSAFQLLTGACGLGPFDDDSCGGGKPQLFFSSNTSQYVYLKVIGNPVGGNVTVAYRDTTNVCPSFPTYNFGTITPVEEPWQTHSATFTAGQVCKRYKFSLVKGRTYRFTFCQGGGSAPFDTVLALYDSTHATMLASNDDFCGLSSEITWVATYTGDHYLDLRDLFFTGGTYTLAYIELCRPCPDAHLVFPQPPVLQYQSFRNQPGWIPQDGCRLYRFTVGGNRRYRFTFCGDEAAGFATFDSFLRLYRASDCSVLLTNDNAPGCGTNSAIEFTAPGPADVILEITGVGGGSGSFNLVWADIGSACPTNDVALNAPAPCGAWTTRDGALVRGGNQRLRINNMVAGKDYVFTLCNNIFAGCAIGPSVGFAGFFDSTMDVTGPGAACTTPAGVVPAACGPDDLYVFFTPTADGAYQINIRQEVSGPGGLYTLAYARTTP